ncbi:DUF1801 domain-containing protein [Gymnodinialimonas hymeniacidonis]|uniref:DUF1801 domain-containing protein n=1 Tax=Gymnodinialimonas hymeniacidonis TaxID=3126508 RepID=UPI0034C61F77
MADATLLDIADRVKRLAQEIAPTVTFQSKYGGEVFVPDPNQPKAFVGGVFIYKDHVSVEFSHGATFDDPGGLLAGKGKARRHVKLESAADLDAKSVEGFLRQALS